MTMRVGLIAAVIPCLASAAAITAVTDNTTYNAGSAVRARLAPAGSGVASIRYAGEDKPLVAGVRIGGEYSLLWKLPWDARNGRYEIDLTPDGGSPIRDAGSFAVHRQLVKVVSVDLDKTFYTAGDAVNPRIVVENLSNQRLENLRVEFEAYTYPWIAPEPGEAPQWKTIVADRLALDPGERKEFYTEKAAVVQATEPVDIYFSVVIRDSTREDRIYDLAFALPAFTIPPGKPLPKQYPFLYLYQHLSDVPKSESYRHFYPPEFVSDVIRFGPEQTMFPTGASLAFRFSLGPQVIPKDVRVLNASGGKVVGPSMLFTTSNWHAVVDPLPPGLYTLEVTLPSGASNRHEFAVNPLPKSILIFCAHEDDDTAHPGIIRAAVENHIPIHFVYFTSGDSGGCDRYYMHSCDAARAMDFGEVRMEEARASLGHLGVPRDAIFFLGMPDGGLGEIWYNHPHSANPYLSVLLASDHAPYREAAIPNLPYSRDAAVAAAKQFILRFHPDMIITGHPDERHVDHRTNNWMVVKAMQELLAEGRLSANTELVVDQVYGETAGIHAPYQYEKYDLYVSGEAAKLGQEATWYYQSQDGNHQQAEIVDYDKLPRKEPYPHYRILDWQQHAGWNERR